jgi:lipopolysaccharide biosynthesis protein
VNNPKIIAFHLPQFHSIPENDQWWGEGFTEWTNVKKARPLYRGHYQPRVPAQRNYYDLLDPDVQDWQANLAREHGIHGFCYYHYWFNGKQLLERPVEQMVERGQPDFPFCLAWANETWTRAWDGGEKQILMPQTYGGPESWRHHIQYLIRIFKDPRYIKVDEDPMLLIYRSSSIREMQPMLELWNAEIRKAGFRKLHLVSMATAFAYDPRVHLFSAYSEFEPNYTISRLSRGILKRERRLKRWTEAYRRIFRHAMLAKDSYDYKCIWQRIGERSVPPHHYPGGFADWDNSPRRGFDHSMVIRNFDKQTFASGMAMQITKARNAGAEFLFFNAWNEWGEGTYLEPDEKRGLFFLECIRDILSSSS